MQVEPKEAQMMESGTGHLELPEYRAKPLTRPRVLLIDDDPCIEMYLAAKLRQCGLDTLYAPDGVTGYQIARKELPSAIVCDYFMPNGDALYVLCRLRSTPLTQDIPVIVMSGKHLDSATERNLTQKLFGRPGVARVISKSSCIQELISALQRLCPAKLPNA
jgi:CheY-like chemotaxis protein